jgi:hypothetical protein
MRTNQPCADRVIYLWNVAVMIWEGGRGTGQVSSARTILSV